MAYSNSLTSSLDSKVSDDEEEKVEKKEVKPSINWINFVKATTDNNPRETVKNGEQPKQNTHRKRALIVNAVRPFNDVHPKRTINAVNQESYFSKQPHSFVQRPDQKLIALKNSYANKKVKTVWIKKVNTAKLKATVNDAKAKAKHKDVKGKRGKSIRAFTRKGVIDSGCSRHMTGNMSFLTDYKEINGGYVAFGGNPKGGKITGKEKPSESDGFEQIVDFINFNQIKWEKIVINEASIRHDLKLNDAEGILINPSLTKKVFANMKRVGTWFSRAVTSLFGTMMVQALEDVGDLPTDVQDTPIPDAPSSSQPHRKYKPRRKQRMETEVFPTETNTKAHVLTPSNDPLPSVLSMQDVNVQSERIDYVVKEVAKEMVEVMKMAKIIVDEVSTAGGELNAANEKPVSGAPTNITTAQPSEATKITVDITTAPKAKGIVFHDKEDSTTRTASLKSLVKDKGKAKIEAGWNANMKDNIDWNEVVEQKQKLEEQEKAEELKKNLEIVPDDEDDVFVNVTPLSSKPPTIMDYKIYKEGKKEHFQIFRANGNHQMYP
nr:hypothetical protein [Tanacetum cinerariifolium]